MKKFLHVGCGPQNKSGLKGFNSNDWQEIRFDIDSNVERNVAFLIFVCILVFATSIGLSNPLVNALAEPAASH